MGSAWHFAAMMLTWYVLSGSGLRAQVDRLPPIPGQILWVCMSWLETVPVVVAAGNVDKHVATRISGAVSTQKPEPRPVIRPGHGSRLSPRRHHRRGVFACRART